MGVYVLTDIGESYAATPDNNPTVARRILYFMRRHGSRATKDQLETHVESNHNELVKAIHTLKNNSAIQEIGG